MAICALMWALLAVADQRPGTAVASQLAKDDDDALRDVAAAIMSDACPRLHIEGYRGAFAAADGSLVTWGTSGLDCGDTMRMAGAVHHRPSYTAEASVDCALFFHPRWERWILGSPWPVWKRWHARGIDTGGAGEGEGESAPVALLMNASPSNTPDEISEYVRGGRLVDPWVSPLDSPEAVALHDGQSRKVDEVRIVCAKEGLPPTPAPPTLPPTPPLPMEDRDILQRMRARTETLQAQERAKARHHAHVQDRGRATEAAAAPTGVALRAVPSSQHRRWLGHSCAVGYPWVIRDTPCIAAAADHALASTYAGALVARREQEYLELGQGDDQRSRHKLALILSAAFFCGLLGLCATIVMMRQRARTRSRRRWRMPDDSAGETVRRLNEMEVGESKEIDECRERRWSQWFQETNAKRKSFADAITNVISGKQRAKSCPSI